MEQRKDIDQKVDETLDSLDGLQRAQPQSWFFARVNARLLRSRNGWEKWSAILSKPSVAFAGLCMVLMMNVYFLWQRPETKSASYTGQNESTVESESTIASNSSFEYENLAQ